MRSDIDIGSSRCRYVSRGGKENSSVCVGSSAKARITSAAKPDEGWRVPFGSIANRSPSNTPRITSTSRHSSSSSGSSTGSHPTFSSPSIRTPAPRTKGLKPLILVQREYLFDASRSPSLSSNSSHTTSPKAVSKRKRLSMLLESGYSYSRGARGARETRENERAMVRKGTQLKTLYLVEKLRLVESVPPQEERSEEAGQREAPATSDYCMEERLHSGMGVPDWVTWQLFI